MKSVIFIFVFFSFSFLGNAKAIYLESSTTICLFNSEPQVLSKRMVRKLKRDAARLTLRMSQEEEDLRYQDITLDGELYDEVFALLSDIYTTTSEGGRLAKCKIHTFPDLPIDRFKIIFDKDINWSESFRNGIFETPDANLNALINEYDLVIDKYIQWNDDYDAVTVRSKNFLNIKALANEFFNIQGIEEIDYGVPSVKGNDIIISKRGQEFQIQFEMALGSQMQKNAEKHMWLFEALNKKIKFVKEDGPVLPEHIRCQISPSYLSAIRT